MNNLDQLKEEIQSLEGELTGNMMEDMKVSGTKPMDTRIDCVGCGS